MSTHQTTPESADLTAWARRAAHRLGVTPLRERDVETVLTAASRASSGLVRSAGPVTMYLAGILLSSGQASDVASACRMAGDLMAIADPLVS